MHVDIDLYIVDSVDVETDLYFHRLDVNYGFMDASGGRGFSNTKRICENGFRKLSVE